ncbi:type II toxin-antitoxin system HipA family toxin [Demequina silvatica]|uniref:type II toxin-antitoxin system HipA family toxin n=1 Tax=Demequina silvatica TaxID=1638988 RepID=UPI000783D979|nr:HipA domain-containing protein [Demequina silvatica]
MATTTSDQVYVWAWLRGATAPVPAGVLERRGGSTDLSFRYGERYKAREGALPLYGMPFDGPTWHGATENLGMPGALRDASPDAWGRRVILQRVKPSSEDTGDLDEATYLMQSGSNRLGAVDFQASSRAYAPRIESATLDELLRAADLIESGGALPEHLERALLYGTAIGGARPKALLADGDRQVIAKFSTSTDAYDVVGAEATSIHLASKLGIPVTRASIAHSLGHKVLLLDRFDRGGDGTRRMVVSGLTMLRLPEQWLPSGSYPALLDTLTREAASAKGLNRAVFTRAAFNIAIGNTDDHLRNHAAFWDGTHLKLTPAYDLSPVLRTGEAAAQALALDWKGNRDSRLSTLVDAAPDYRLDRETARGIAEEVTDVIREHWQDAADFGELPQAQRALMWERMFLNPGSVRGIAG